MAEVLNRMPKMNIPSFKIAVEDFDRSLLDANAGEPGSDSFLLAVQAFFGQEYRNLGGKINVVIDRDLILVSWEPDRMLPEYVDIAVERLHLKDYEKGTSILRSLLEFAPDDEDVLYNLGMAESDMGQLAQAEKHLRQLVELAPKHVNALVALGVALKRQHKDNEAIRVLVKATEMNPRNSYAHRNLGACLLSAGEPIEAERHLREAVGLQAEDPQAWLGLAQAREARGKIGEADEAYVKAIELDSTGDIGEMARQARSKIAQEEYDKRAKGEVRMDAVMYCLAALEKFQAMAEGEVRNVTLEIALLGRGGLDVNDSAKSYSLSSIPDQYSGLQLVCMMYVGFKVLGIEQDAGFDLSGEYDAALKLHQKKIGQ